MEGSYTFVAKIIDVSSNIKFYEAKLFNSHYKKKIFDLIPGYLQMLHILRRENDAKSRRIRGDKKFGV